MPLPTKEENPNGFHQRYIVTKADGSPIDPEAIYLVLRLDGKNRLAERFGARAYARELRGTALEQCGRDITKLCDQLVSE